jgi:arsenite oxidase large subunit
MDPPGDARPDWRIVAEVARKMGFRGFDWRDSNEIFEESAAASEGSRTDFLAVVEKARSDGVRAHDLLREFGTDGIQLPARLDKGKLVGTPRLHTDLRFKTDSGKANFVFPDWDAVERRNRILAPTGDELWVTNGRVNHLWNNLFDYTRRPYTIQRWPMNFLQVNPKDARARGIESGDLVEVSSDRVPNQVGRRIEGSFTAVAYVTDEVPPGVTFAYFHYPKSPANAVTPADTRLQPLNLRYQFKLGSGGSNDSAPPSYSTACPSRAQHRVTPYSRLAPHTVIN